MPKTNDVRWAVPTIDDRYLSGGQSPPYDEGISRCWNFFDYDAICFGWGLEMNSARDDILRKLKADGKTVVPPRPELPELNELSLNREELIDKFSQEISALSGVVTRVKDKHGVLARLKSIFQAEKIRPPSLGACMGPKNLKSS